MQNSPIGKQIVGLNPTPLGRNQIVDFNKNHALDAAPQLINYTAALEVHRLLSAIGRTEDIQFFPDNQRLAIAGFNQNQILLLDVERSMEDGLANLHFPKGTVLHSTTFNRPHGLSWLANETLIVANRNSNVGLFRIPPTSREFRDLEIEPFSQIRCDATDGLQTPGSVTALQTGDVAVEVLVCNNSANTVTSHILDITRDFDVISSVTLLERGLVIPDSIAVDQKAEWIAVSNHSDHSVYMYENSPELSRSCMPQGTLRGMLYPHGLRFSADGRSLFVADAGAPFVYVYTRIGSDWCGDFYPLAKLRVMGDAAYNRGRANPQEGGPKGLDLTSDGTILVATCEEEPFVCIDLTGLRLPGSPVKPGGTGQDATSILVWSLIRHHRIRRHELDRINAASSEIVPVENEPEPVSPDLPIVDAVADLELPPVIETQLIPTESVPQEQELTAGLATGDSGQVETSDSEIAELPMTKKSKAKPKNGPSRILRSFKRRLKSLDYG